MNYEKERYVWKTVKNSNFSYACIYDSKDGRNLYTNELILNMLNQQDKHIKELENSNQKTQDYYWSEINKLDELYNKDLEERLEEVKQLKQSQKQVLISVLEDVMSIARKGIDDYWSLKYICTIIENKIKKLKDNTK